MGTITTITTLTTKITTLESTEAGQAGALKQSMTKLMTSLPDLQFLTFYLKKKKKNSLTLFPRTENILMMPFSTIHNYLNTLKILSEVSLTNTEFPLQTETYLL